MGTTITKKFKQNDKKKTTQGHQYQVAENKRYRKKFFE
jgi:hypothetical protein